MDYRENHSEWLERNTRLVNIVLSRGRYETRLNCNCFFTLKKKKKVHSLNNFIIRLYSEIGVLHDQFLNHPRLKWTKVEEDKLLKDGKPKGIIPCVLIPLIVQYCDNEVFGIIHCTFHQNVCIVRS